MIMTGIEEIRLQLAGFALLGILQFDFENHGGADLGVIIAFGVMVSLVVSLSAQMLLTGTIYHAAACAKLLLCRPCYIVIWCAHDFNFNMFQLKQEAAVH